MPNAAEAGGPLSSPFRFRNWSRQHDCRPSRVFRPHATTEIVEIVTRLAGEKRRARVVGSLHSPNDIAMSEDTVIVLPRAEDAISVDAAESEVTVPGGVSLHAVNTALARAGFALPVLGSIADQTVAGAIATATHGTGLRFGTLSSLVRRLELVTPRHGLVRASRDENPEIFHAACTSLGVLGVHVSFTLGVVPAFKLSVHERPTSIATALAALPERLSAHDYHRLWYLPHTETVWEWTADRVPLNTPDQPPAPKPLRRTWWNEGRVGRHVFEGLLFAATFDERLVPPLNRWYAAAQFAKESRWIRPSVDGFLIDCLFRQHVDEWAIPIEHAADALRQIDRLVKQGGFIAQLPIEIRFAPADDAWLSPCHGRPSCYIGVIAYRPLGRDFAFAPFFAAFEQVMRSFDGRPHWAKTFEVAAHEFARMYAHWDDFDRVRRLCDPDGVFGNAFTDRLWPDAARARSGRSPAAPAGPLRTQADPTPQA